jgi:hypothetical protein
VKVLKDTENEFYYYLLNDPDKNQRVINKKFIKESKVHNTNTQVKEQETKTPDKNDIIVYNNGDEVLVDIVDIGKENIIYRKDGKEITYIIPISQVAKIQYSDGQVIEFNKNNLHQNSVIRASNELAEKSNSLQEAEVIGGDIDKNRLVGFVFGGKIGYFMPFNDGIMEMYGPGFTYGLGVGYWARNGFGWNLEFRDYAKRGRVTTSGDFTSTKVELMSLTTSFNYAFVEKGKFKTYAGLAAGVAFFSISDQSEAYKETLFEYFPYGGIYFKPFHVELRFKNVKWEETNVGGFEICGGVIF